MTYYLAGILLMGLVFILLQACTHESFGVIDPNPIDTTGNPIDTTGNPTDTTTGIPCDPNVVYFENDILPILRSNCAKSGCHDAATHKEGLVLDSYQNVIASRLIKPFNANNSELLKVIKDTDPEDRMPPSPNQKLSNDQVSLITKWIQQGAKELTCDANAGQCVTTGVSYSGFVAPLLANYCVGCHSGSFPSGGISLASYANVQSVAQSGRLYGAISWASGYSKMPKGGSKLSQCNIDKIKGWIDDGSPNN